MRGTATTRAWALTTAMDGDASSTTGQEQGPPLFALRGFVLYGSFGTWDSRSYLTNVLGSPSWSSMMASLAGAKAMTKASLFNEGLFAGAAASIRASNLQTRLSANDPGSRRRRRGRARVLAASGALGASAAKQCSAATRPFPRACGAQSYAGPAMNRARWQVSPRLRAAAASAPGS